MRLFAKMRSERRSREAHKGGNERINIELSQKGIREYELVYTPESLEVKNGQSGRVILDTSETDTR